jgi:hypothetical protein
VGLDPLSSYHVEVDDEEMYEVEPDRSGTVFIKGLRPGVGVRFSRRSEHGDLPAATDR